VGTVSPEVCKLPLPANTSLGSIQTHCFIFHSTSPVTLPGADRKATEVLLRSVIETANRDFSTNLNANIIIADSLVSENATEKSPGSEKTQVEPKTVIMVGASNMRRLIPHIKAAGYNVVDFTQSSWLATPDNVEKLAEKIISIKLEPDHIIVLELFGNSTFRYRQFDGTMALPFKAGHCYHMEGEVGVCDDTSFINLYHNLRPVFDACKESVKIVIPPLPRYLYSSCCQNKHHCTNQKQDGYQLDLLKNTTHFRTVLKDALLSTGTERFFVVDGVGGLLGVPAGENRGPATENISELKQHCLPDGVHYTDSGYTNLAKVICGAATGIMTGTLTKAEPQNLSGKPAGSVYFWRGFTSPTGISGIKKMDNPVPLSHQQQPHGGGPLRGQPNRQSLLSNPPPLNIARLPTNNFPRNNPNHQPRRHYPYWRN
jgi:hypothetical protein